MSTYRAPLRDMQFALRELAGIDDVATLPGCEDTLDVLDSVLEEAAAFRGGRARPAQSHRRQGGLHLERRRGHDAARLQGGL